MEHESFLKKSLKRLDELLEGKTWDVERISSLSAHLNNVRGKIMVIPSHGYNHRNSHRNNRYGHTHDHGHGHGNNTRRNDLFTFLATRPAHLQSQGR